MQLHLGPFDIEEAYRSTLRPDAFRYNPRCFTRSLNSYISSIFMNQTSVDRLLASTDITDFQTTINFNPSVTDFGIHGGGHFTLGETMADMFSSPQDPAFMLHHGMVDRLWAMWQAEDERTRRYAMNGSSTMWDRPNTPPVTVETEVEFGVLDRPRRMGELMDPRGFHYCYEYA